MADSTTEIDLDSVIDRLLEGELAHYHRIRTRGEDLKDKEMAIHGMDGF